MARRQAGHIASPLRRGRRAAGAQRSTTGWPPTWPVISAVRAKVAVCSAATSHMIASGGRDRCQSTKKKSPSRRHSAHQLSGPGMRIGMGASAIAPWPQVPAAELDFDSITAFELSAVRKVINHCWAQAQPNPQPSDVGAGSLVTRFSWADQRRWARRTLTCALYYAGESWHPKLEQKPRERYVLAIAPRPRRFGPLRAWALPVCRGGRSRRATSGGGRRGAAHERRGPSRVPANAVDMPMDVLLGRPLKMHRDVTSIARQGRPLALDALALEQAVVDVLAPPRWPKR